MQWELTNTIAMSSKLDEDVRDSLELMRFMNILTRSSSLHLIHKHNRIFTNQTNKHDHPRIVKIFNVLLVKAKTNNAPISKAE
jgi:hypothetical protein